MAKPYMSVRAVAEKAGVSVQAVYKWIQKGELKAEVVRISDYEKRYHILPGDAARIITRTRSGLKSRPAGSPGKTMSLRKSSGADAVPAKPRTGAELAAALESNGLMGMWADREDIGDSVEYARTLRRRASTRRHD